MYKRTAYLSVLMLLLSFTVGCSSASIYQKSIYGDKSKITSEGDSYNFINKIENITDHECALKYGSFTGMDTLWSIQSQGNGSITIDYDSKLQSGRFKCVLITPDNEVVDIFEGTGKNNAVIQLKNGTTRIKIVGNGASGSMAVAIHTDGDAVSKSVD